MSLVEKESSISQLMASSGVQFGTSGARGLVSAMSDAICYAYTCAFTQQLTASQQLKPGTPIAIAGDLRPSTPRILNAIAAAIQDQLHPVIHCGFIPTPAVVCYGLHQGYPSIMVTGSHIPDDRNGIKFNTAQGEITKSDEAGMRRQRVTLPTHLFLDSGLFAPGIPHADCLPVITRDAYKSYVDRYLHFFPPEYLRGKRVGLYQHSSVGRDLFVDILQGLGAKVIPLGRANSFISVDTEAVRAEDIVLARQWAQEQPLDAIISADGDADRPLVSDEQGEWLRGDIAGVLTAHYLQADVVATPVSSNTAVDLCGFFKRVLRTRIGSPYVIAAMQEALRHGISACVVGYEANGGFLTASDITLENRTLAALPTRDAILVPLALLALAGAQGVTLSALQTTLPKRFTSSNRLQAFATERSQAVITSLHNDNRAINAAFAHLCGNVVSVDNTDGLRMTFDNGEIIHLRPSGNAPEFRCYNEAATAKRALELNRHCMDLLEQWRQ